MRSDWKGEGVCPAGGRRRAQRGKVGYSSEPALNPKALLPPRCHRSPELRVLDELVCGRSVLTAPCAGVFLEGPRLRFDPPCRLTDNHDLDPPLPTNPRHSPAVQRTPSSDGCRPALPPAPASPAAGVVLPPAGRLEQRQQLGRRRAPPSLDLAPNGRGYRLVAGLVVVRAGLVIRLDAELAVGL